MCGAGYPGGRAGNPADGSLGAEDGAGGLAIGEACRHRGGDEGLEVLRTGLGGAARGPEECVVPVALGLSGDVRGQGAERIGAVTRPGLTVRVRAVGWWEE